jgi:hypothetical protein
MPLVDLEQAEAWGPDRDRIAVLLTDAQELVRVENHEAALEPCRMAASLGPFEALRIVARLVEAGIVGARA